MNRVRVGGGMLTLAGLAAYVAGVQAPYPGRGFSLAIIMVGLTLLAIGGIG